MIIWCELGLSCENILLGFIYRTLENSERRKEKIFGIIREIKKAKKLVDNKRVGGLVLVGDFNLPGIQWVGGLGTGGKNEIEKIFSEGISDLYLSQCVTKPTFIYRDGSEGNILDILIVEDGDRIMNLELGPPLGSVQQGHVQMSLTYVLKGPKP